MERLPTQEIARLRRELAAERSCEAIADPADWMSLLDEVERARALLKRIEYASYIAPFDAACPACRSGPEDGHADGCELAALLPPS